MENINLYLCLACVISKLYQFYGNLWYCINEFVYTKKNLIDTVRLRVKLELEKLQLQANIGPGTSYSRCII